MTTLFNLRSDAEVGKEHCLLLEAGNDFCCYAYWHKQANKIDELQYISFEETEAEESLLKVLEEAGSRQPQSAVICSALAEALLVPARFFHQEETLLSAVYGERFYTRQQDPIPEWQLVNDYLLPLRSLDHLHQLFTSVKFFHAYTPNIKIFNGYATDNQLIIHFTPRNFRVLLKKDAAIHLAQTYSYKTPLDVVYYLLKICYEFELTQAGVHLILSGLIEKDSGLFAELLQYFNNVHFAHPPEIALPDDKHPHHFFTSLYNLALCAS